MSQPISLAIESGIAVITVDSPPVNAISAAIRRGLLSITRDLATRQDVKAVVFLCAGRTFMAGADISEFGGVMAPPELRNRMARLDTVIGPLYVAWNGRGVSGNPPCSPLMMALSVGPMTAISSIPACCWRILRRAA